MKVSEITESLVKPKMSVRQIEKDLPLKKLSDFSKRKNFDLNLTGGAYAWGVQDPRDPFIYRKKNRVPSYLEKDSYYKYITEVVISNQDNPFFPRVYDVILKKDSGGLIKPEYRIEKLYEYSEIATYYPYERDLDEILLDMYFSNSDEYGLITMLRYALTNSYTAQYIKNKKLLDAVNLIRALVDRYGFEIDMHASNIMFRLGKTIPQLVITDPVSDAGASIVGDFNPFK